MGHCWVNHSAPEVQLTRPTLVTRSTVQTPIQRAVTENWGPQTCYEAYGCDDGQDGDHGTGCSFSFVVTEPVEKFTMFITVITKATTGPCTELDQITSQEYVSMLLSHLLLNMNTTTSLSFLKESLHIFLASHPRCIWRK